MGTSDKFESDEKYDKIIKLALGKAALTGPLIITLPGADLAAMGAVWGTMATDIAKENNIALKGNVGKVAVAVITGVGAYVVAAKIVLSIVSKVPGIGMVAGSGVNAAANALMTLWFAFGLIDLFDKNRGVSSLEDHVAHLIKEVKPRAGMTIKVRRAAAFVRRMRKK